MAAVSSACLSNVMPSMGAQAGSLRSTGRRAAAWAAYIPPGIGAARSVRAPVSSIDSSEFSKWPTAPPFIGGRDPSPP